MAVTTLPADSPEESLKQNIKSLTCTASTVSALQALLRGPQRTSQDGGADKTSRGAKFSGAETRRKPASQAKPKSAPKAVALQLSIATEDVPPLTFQQRLVLATEVFNIASKALADAAQKQSHSKTPLSHSSSNQMLSPKKSAALKTQVYDPQRGTENHIYMVAECARIALSSLRTLKNGDKQQLGEEYPNLQLEQGVCVLVSRMLAVGLSNLAYKELKALQKRIQSHLDRQASTQNAKLKRAEPAPARQDDTVKETMVDLLMFNHFACAKSTLGLIVSFQANVLRLLLAERKVSLLKKLGTMLSLSEPSSPANIIQTATKLSALSKEKAALQLISLSNNVISLVSSRSKPINDEASSSHSQIKPLIILNLQLLSLEIRAMSWRISEHNIESKQELLDPMSRFLEGFAHSGSTIDRAGFKPIFDSFNRLRKSSGLGRDAMPWRLLFTIGGLAYDSGHLEEASSLYDEAVSLLPSLSGDQPLSLGTIRCRVATMRLGMLKSVNPDISNIASSMTDASDGLKSFNKGNNYDLEELFVESAHLKKQAMSVFGDLYSIAHTSPPLMEELGRSIVGYLHAFIRFLKRYIGRFSESENAGGYDKDICAQSLASSRKVLISALDSVVAMGKASVINQTPSWEDVSPIFTDCRRLVSMMPSQPDSPEEFEELKTSLMKISNIFWTKYLKEKESTRSSMEILPLLEQSTLFLQDCSLSDRKTGFAALKYERLAYLYLDCHSRSRAVGAFRQSIREHIESDAFSEFVNSLNGRLPQSVCCDASKPAFSLSRVFAAYLKIQIKRQQQNALYDDDALSAEQRAMIKEWQVGILMDIHRHEMESDFVPTMLQDALSSVFVIYIAETFPLRRLRLIGHVLWLTLGHPVLLSEEFVKSLADEARQLLSVTETNRSDTELIHFATHIRNHVRLALCFYNNDSDLDEFREILDSWNAIITKCHGLTCLQQIIDDPDRWLAHMKFTSDFMEARGWWKLQLLTLQTAQRILEFHESSNTELIINLAKCAQIYIRLGDCHSAFTALDQAALHIDGTGVRLTAIVFFALVRAEFFLGVGNLQRAEQMLSLAGEKYSSIENPSSLTSDHGDDKNFMLRLIIDAAVLFSHLYHGKGRLWKALYFAKVSVKISLKLWARLERSTERSKGTTHSPTEQSVIELEPEKSTLPHSESHSASKPSSFSAGTVFFPYIHSHCIALMNLGRLSAHNGLFQDAIYYGEQALKVSEAVNARVRIIACKAQLGREWLRGGRVSEAKRFLAAAVEMCKGMDNSVETIACKIGLASMYMARRNHNEVLRLLCDAENSMAGLLNLSFQMTKLSADSELEEGIANLSIRNNSLSKAKKTVSKRPTRKGSGASSNSTINVSNGTQVAEFESQEIIQLRVDILQEQATALSMKHNYEEALRLLNQAKQLQSSLSSQILLQIAEAEHILAGTMRSIASHAVYCVLAESTLSIPSIEEIPMQASEPSAIQKSTKAKRTTRKTVKTLKQEPVAEKENKEPKLGELLGTTKLSIQNTIKNATSFGSTMESHCASRLGGNVSMLLHATTPGAMEQASLTPAMVNELGRNTAFDRERLAIDLDKQLADLSAPLSWPSLPEHFEFVGNDNQQSPESYAQILPSNWNVISISIDSNANEFIISKMRRDAVPFMLRLPLKRGGDENEGDEEEFTFMVGKEEMKQIIQLANTSAHDARSRTDKKARKDWWAIRESLDQRLKALLDNMENIWLGGFRSVFSALPRVEGLFSQFSTCFEGILNKHLPSRRKSGDNLTRIRLHPDVLELFVGIRNLHETEDPENPITDLLYFVVDILQFQGERNAYDEIDFDAMVIDTLDAVKRYHETCDVKSQTTVPQHTILILDKALHLFPWESLPCFEGLPVSRMPSLKSLLDRIVQLGIGSSVHDASRLLVDRNAGSYILNPSGDLRTTQSNFEKDLNHMVGWSAIVDRSPSEEEFRTALESKALFLYFGHGSGAQYIRGRVIKRLERCAVAFLMGCSSGCLTETGEFEPYGTPMNYMHAGSPALVATLWDVTDKDIDRFAQSTFDKWGLIKEVKEVDTRETWSNRAPKKGDKSATRAPGVETPCSTSLAEAVAMSRESCHLRYLNGAAPVIYGLPMILGP